MRKFTKEIASLLATVTVGISMGSSPAASEEIMKLTGQATDPDSITDISDELVSTAGVAVAPDNITEPVTTALTTLDSTTTETTTTTTMPSITGTMVTSAETTTTTIPPLAGVMEMLDTTTTTTTTTTMPYCIGTSIPTSTTTTTTTAELPPLVGDIAPARGDSNCDGQLDMADAVLIMQSLANPNKYGLNGTAPTHITVQGKENADMDGNGLTVGDAQIIQRKLLGLPETDSNSSEVKKEMKIADVKELAKKGSDITWADLEEYDLKSFTSYNKDNNKKIEIDDGDGYSLVVTGIYPDSISHIGLYRGKDKTDFVRAEGISIVTEDIDKYISESEEINAVIAEIGSLSSENIKEAKLKPRNNDPYITLNEEQIKDVTALLHGIKLYKKDNSYEALSFNSCFYSITNENGKNLIVEVIDSYIIINGEGYFAQDGICTELSQLANVIRKQHSVQQNEWLKDEVYLLEKGESAAFDVFPDMVFTWTELYDNKLDLTENKISLIKTDNENAGSFIIISDEKMASAYFADINGDGFPEICAVLKNGKDNLYIAVYDVHNDKMYKLYDSDEQYWLSCEDGKLTVNSQSVLSAWGPGTHPDATGRLALNDGKLVMVEEEK